MIIDSRYEVLERLAQSNLATVYKVKDIRTDNIYSLKILQGIEPEELYERFSAEDMHHITKIEHPNLIHISSFGIYENEIYYLSEYYPGRTLKYLTFKPYQTDMFYSMIVQICYGLNALHSQNIIHKDLKPENIMFKHLGADVQVKILDYGFSRGYEDEEKAKITGTLPYVAPEVLLGKPATPRSDFYSLGIALYKLTTGAFPFTLDQIYDFISRRTHVFFPRFPKELNPDIPLKLEKLILKLLEIKPENRFQSAVDIISYINRIQSKKFPFSIERSFVDNMKFSSYLVREDYSHTLLEYLPIVEENSGKLVIVKGGIGLGKNNMLSLFRYHLLTDKHFLFDYECSTSHKNPFFALIKEFSSYLSSNRQSSTELKQISQKFQKFLHGDDEDDIEDNSTETELQEDYIAACEFLKDLSEQKPLVFIIRQGQYVTKETVEFLQFVRKLVLTSRIFIIISANDVSMLKKIPYAVQLQVQPLSLLATNEYVNQLLPAKVPKSFVEKLWTRTNGNPYFIRDVLIDLIENQKILIDGKFDFDYSLDTYQLPPHLFTLIHHRVSYLTQSAYYHLQKLSVCATPLSKKLMQSILELNSVEMIRFLQEVVENEMLVAKGEFYEFSFSELRERFLKELGANEKVEISKKLLHFFENNKIATPQFCRGIIQNALLAEDYKAMHDYKLSLIKIYNEKYEHEKAFDEISEIIASDFSQNLELSKQELTLDFELFLEKALLTGNVKKAIRLLNALPQIPDDYIANYCKGSLLLSLEIYSTAEKHLKKALQLAENNNDKINSMLELVWLYIRTRNHDEAEKYIDLLAKEELDIAQKIRFVDRHSILLNDKGQMVEAVSIAEDYLRNIPSSEDIYFYIALGNLNNNLAYIYSHMREVNQAEKYFNEAREIWESIRYIKALPTVYNNLGDLAVMQGYTNSALKFFDKAKKIYEKIELPIAKIVGYINYGEFYIKTGEFEKAVYYLEKAERLIMVQEDKSFEGHVQANLSLAKSKTGGYNNYYSYVSQVRPQLLQGQIPDLSPFTKTYFYYLINTGQIQELNKILHSIKDEREEEEFFEQIRGKLAYEDGNYQTAIGHFNTALNFAENKNTVYGQTINLIRLAESYCLNKNYEEAVNSYYKALAFCDRYNFKYWKCYLEVTLVKIELLNPEIPLRKLLRRLNNNLIEAEVYDYYLIVIENIITAITVYKELKAEHSALETYAKLLNYLEKCTKNLPPVQKIAVYKKYNCENKHINELEHYYTMPRIHQNSESWHEYLYDLMRLKEIDRIRFFISKLIEKLISPHSISIVFSETNKFSIFLAQNFEIETVNSNIYKERIENCIETGRITKETLFSKNTLFVPLGIKRSYVGAMVIADDGELEFTETEIKVVKELRLHLSSLLSRIQEFKRINRDMKLIDKLMRGTRSFFTILDTAKLEHEIVSFCIDFTGASRGLLIKRGKTGNFVFQVALNEEKENISNESSISKTVLSEVQAAKKPVYTYNAKEDNTFKNSISVQDYNLHSIYCSPIVVDGEFYGFLYLDDYESKNDKMQILSDFMEMLIFQVSAAIKNANQYEVLMEKTLELHTIDQVKENFMAIVSHELNTPLVALQGYVSRLLRNRFETEDDRKQIAKKIRQNLSRLSTTTNDIINMNRYRIAKKLELTLQPIDEILELIVEEAKLTAFERNLEISLQIQPDLPHMWLNAPAFHLMVYNILMNSIRYTKDNGVIQIGVRDAAYQQEELPGKKTLVVYVMDTGDGIPEEELKNIFKSFYEVKDKLLHKSGVAEYNSSGLGVGLTTAKRIAELHHGKIDISSKENVGSTVYISLPVNEIPNT